MAGRPFYPGALLQSPPMNEPVEAPPVAGLPENAHRPLRPGETYNPVVPAEAAPPEFTRRALFLGLGMTVLFSAAAAYIALKLGQGIETAIPIAILAVGYSALVRRPSTLLENLQVVALGATAGIVVGGSVFVMPAFFLLDLDQRTGFAQIFLVPFLGATLGVLFLIPFRRYFVADMHGKLPFPEATASTEVLVAGERGGESARVLLAALGGGFALDYLALGFKTWTDNFTSALLPLGDALARKVKAVFTLNTSAAVLGLGYIVGVRYASIICAGSFLSYLVLVPLVARIGGQVAGPLFPGLPAVADLDAAGIFKNYVRPIGIGGIFAAGLISIGKMSPVIVEAIRQVFGQIRKRGAARAGEEKPRTDRDVPMTTVALLILATAAAIGLYFRFGVLAGQPSAGLKTIVALALTLGITFLFASVSAWAVAMISTTPISGMTITTLIVSAVTLAGIGLSGPDGSVALLLIGGVVCTALSMTGSMATLMKMGYWLGGTPKRIQGSLILGSALASMTVTAVIILFAHTKGYVVGPGHPEPMPAPQANAMAAVVRSVMASAGAPWFLYGLGAVIAVIVEMVGVSALAFALGMYLPLELNTPILGGALVGWFIQRSAKGDERLAKARNDRGTLVASGLIAGGALAGVLDGVVAGVEQTFHLEWFDGHMLPHLPWNEETANILGLVVFLALAYIVYRDARRVRA